MRILLYGDIGGHWDPWAESLARHGCKLTDKGLVIPKGTIVVQAGDLVDRGPKSDELVFAINRTLEFPIITHTDQRYFQIFGNHEGNLIGGVKFGGYDEDTDKKTKNTLKKWWKEDLAQMALGIVDVDGNEWLVTHAGLGSRKWRYYGMVTDLSRMVKKLNGDNLRDAFTPGNMLGGYWESSRHSKPVGVAWAHAFSEVYATWQGVVNGGGEVPWNQVHGHSSMHNWFKGKTDPNFNLLVGDVPEGKPKPVFELNPDKRFTMCYIGDKVFAGIDQNLGRDPWFDVEPFILEGEIVT